MNAKPRIVVVGSLNVDWTSRVKHLPLPGQTVAASSLTQTLGGKGANQAIAAARQDAEVLMIGCLGDDASGKTYREHLRREGVCDQGISTISDTLTGTAMIAVDDQAENQIIVASGANGQITPAHIQQHESSIAAADLLLIQWEIPLEVVVKSIETAALHGVPVVMNPSPLQTSFPWGSQPLHTLLINEGEAEAIFGTPTLSTPSLLQDALRTFRVSHLIITRGSASTISVTADGQTEHPVPAVEPVDTVGAGDSFAGAYAACLARKMDFASCVRYANVAGSLATLKEGAQGAIPHRAQIEQALLQPGARLP